MNYSWDLIRSFQAVADAGSLSAASRHLGLAQPTIGRHIDMLEAELKVPLFVRSREGMKLTDRGADLIITARQMMESAIGFDRLAAGLDEDISGTVRISANEIFGVMILPKLLGNFMRENPGIDVELVVDNAVSNLLKRDADIAIRMFRPQQNDLMARKIASLRLGFFAHRDYIARAGMPDSFEDLKQHEFIGMDRDMTFIEGAWMLGVELLPSDFTLRTDSILGHIGAIRGGAGIGATHHGLAEQWGDVVPVLPETPFPALELWIACHSDVQYNKRIRLLMDFLARHLKTPYAWCSF
ncbi:MAG: LysR family transcriptional regulator [Cohaesibacteraceae bacterium]|nr:LysR family transcriptional regulator [Cohaesibacteraceae bacterium]